MKMNTLEKLEQILETNNALLTGGGGVGKSYLCQEIIKSYRAKGKSVVVLGSTGISAIGVGGVTIHSFFKFGIIQDIDNLKKQDRKNKAKIKELNEIIAFSDLIIIDEISMVGALLLDMIRYRLEKAEFGGSLLFVGDFFQLPPINKNINNGLFSGSIYAFESSSWGYFNPYVLELSIPKRTKDLEFFEVLSKLRVGKLFDDEISYLKKLRRELDIDETTVLFGTNLAANNLNIQKLRQIDSPLIQIPAVETFYDSVNAKRLQSWKKGLPISEVLDLKIGAKVLFCANKWEKYYNGEQGVLTQVNNDSLIVRKANNKLVEVQMHEFRLIEMALVDDKVEEITLASIKQYPLKLAYALTIHKSQGMSIDNLICTLDNIFESGQLYVALSRAKDPKTLCLRYSGANFEEHIKKHSITNQKVMQFYENVDKILLEEI